MTAATMHLEENAAKWWQAYKQGNKIPSWNAFCSVVLSKFGADDFRTTINGMLALKQTGTIEEYTLAFQALQYNITMHNSHYDEIFFASTYVAGLKDDIRVTIEPHVPLIVDRATLIAKIQQRNLERNKAKYNRAATANKPWFQRNEQPNPPNNPNLQRIRQLRDYRRANNLCFACGDKFEPGHQEVCPKRQKPHINALVVNDLDKTEITEDMLNQLVVEDALTKDFCQLSLNALSSAETENSMKLKTMVRTS